MKTIKLTQGYSTIVNDEDYDKLNQYKWRVHKQSGHFYAVKWKYLGNNKRTSEYMHKIILSDAQSVTHINGDGLDNRRENLKPKENTMATCHKNKKHVANGYCAKCYRDNRPPAPCHPDKPTFAKNLCKKCFSAEKWKNMSSEDKLKSSRRTLLLKYNLTQEQYEEMLKAQGGVCAICKNPSINKSLATDHDHKTNKIRNLLDSNCNAALGCYFDRIELIQNTIYYLENPIQINKANCKPNSYYQGKYINTFKARCCGGRKSKALGLCVDCYSRARNINFLYKISWDEYCEYLKIQNGTCAICKKIPDGPKGLAVDHIEGTTSIKGLLCKNCNTAAGMFKHDTNIMKEAIKYLEKHNTSQN